MLIAPAVAAVISNCAGSDWMRASLAILSSASVGGSVGKRLISREFFDGAAGAVGAHEATGDEGATAAVKRVGELAP